MSSGAPLYPSASILSHWAERDWRHAEGVQLEHLEHMQRMIVRTCPTLDGETLLTAPVFSIAICPMTLAASA